MIESDFYTTLSTAAPVTALVATRIYPLTLPTSPTLPAIDYKVIASSTEGNFTSRGATRLRIEVNCWGATYADAITLRAAVVATLDALRAPTYVSHLSTLHDDYDHELLQYRAGADFYVWTNL